tara:strand:- start:1035 stop:2558 length:1524 start_codon:yes stop_codon:yes gene_type:complete
MSFINFNNRENHSAEYSVKMVREALLAIESKNINKVNSLLEGFTDNINMKDALDLFSNKLDAMSALDEAKLNNVDQIIEAKSNLVKIKVKGKQIKVNIDTLEIEGIDTRDYPDFVDAFFSYAEDHKGKELSDDELDVLTDEHSDLINELIFDQQLYAGLIVTEGKSINKIQKEWAEVTADMASTVKTWKTSEGETKTQLLDKLRALNIRKKELEVELDRAVMGKDRNVELSGAFESVVNEAASLVDEVTGKAVKLPYKTKDFRGDAITVKGFTEPHKSSSSGRIQTDQGEFFPGVAGVKIVGHKFESVIIEGNAFLGARAKAIEEDKEEFEFNGKTFKVTTKVNEGAVKRFEYDFNQMVKDIKRGYGWIAPDHVAFSWENSSDSIDFELVKGELYRRLIDLNILAHGDEDNPEAPGEYVKSLKSLNVKELVAEAKLTWESLKESLGLNEAAPKMTSSKETDNILELRDMVANASKGGSGRYSKEFDKAKTKALRAIEQMLTYTKIGS